MKAAENAIEVEALWKKFHRGEFFDSLRDAIPAVTKGLFGSKDDQSELSRNDFWALQDVSFSVKRGEALGVIGHNGAGKSTLLKILSRILKPNRGGYRISGQMRSLIEIAAGFHEDLTGIENIYLNGAILGMKPKEIKANLDRIIAFSELGDFVSTPVKRYSVGMKARLGFSVAAHMNPDILLIDEVLSVGDAAFRSKCVRHMQHLVDSGVAVIFISHNLDQVKLLCDRTLLLHGGKVRFTGPTEEACHLYHECLRERSTDAFDHERRREEPAYLEGAVILDPETREVVSAVPQNHPCAIEIAYRVQKPEIEVGLGVTLFSATAGGLTSFNTLSEDLELPNTPGEHRVCLNIDQLPLADGTYLISVDLYNTRTNQLIDTHHHQYILCVEGGKQIGRFALQLPHHWTPEPAGVSTP